MEGWAAGAVSDQWATQAWCHSWVLSAMGASEQRPQSETCMVEGGVDRSAGLSSRDSVARRGPSRHDPPAHGSVGSSPPGGGRGPPNRDRAPETLRSCGSQTRKPAQRGHGTP